MTSDLERLLGTSVQSEYPVEAETLAHPIEWLGGGAKRRIDSMASHMFYQLKEYEAAQQRTREMFNRLLCQLEETVATFQHAFFKRELPAGHVSAQIDGDRSIGILHLLWHNVSFVMRGNTRPMALHRNGRDPLFTGRIVALLGDYHERVIYLNTQELPDLLEDEFASLYIPAAPTQPAVMRFCHRKEEFFFHPAEATQQFLLKILEALCGGGYFHESTVP